jgi:GMP synthase-like glutamine amidotransferase
MSKVIGILNAYHFDMTPGSYQEKYEPMILDYFTSIMPENKFIVYQVAQNQFPTTTDECDAWVITGSPASAYDNEIWVTNLIQFTKDLHSKKSRILGICFGHQLIAKALGGKVENSKKGWGIGVRSFDIIQKTSWMHGEDQNCAVLFSHQDQVTELPPGGINLGSEPFCPIQMYSIEDHVFSLQGHPEFTKDYAKERYSTRKKTIGLGVYLEAMESMDDEISDKTLASWIKEFLIH